MILRSATAAGLEGVLLPRRGVPGIDPLVIKASAGVAFHAPVLRAGTAAAGLAALADAEVTTTRAFEPSAGVLARALARTVVVATGLDPTASSSRNGTR